MTKVTVHLGHDTKRCPLQLMSKFMMVAIGLLLSPRQCSDNMDTSLTPHKTSMALNNDMELSLSCS